MKSLVLAALVVPAVAFAGDDPHAGHGGHAQHDQHAQHAEPATPAEPVDHSQHGDHAGHTNAPSTTPVPEPTDADRAAALRPASGHAAHDHGLHRFVLFDRLEAGRADGHDSTAWALHAWFGTDTDRLWIRSEGERTGSTTERADVELLYGRGVTPWWDVVAGVRQDFGAGPSQTLAAFGMQGMTPYKIEAAITGYVGEGGQTALRAEAEYDTLLGERLILQWLAEAEAYGRRDDRRGIGAGLNSFEAGVRLRYEFRREFAPYVGVAWERVYGDVADARRAEGDDIDELRFVAGVRFWF